MNEIVNALDIKKLTGKHALFAEIHALYGAPPNWSRPPGFVSMCKFILEQQVSLASALAHFTKLNNYIPAFTPANILRLSDQEMRMCQISRQKSVYLRTLSETIEDGKLDLDNISAWREPEIRKALTSIKGIGHWTTDVYLMFCLQHKDIFPVGDIAVVNTVRVLTKADTREEILALAEAWKPFRSLATYFLWHHYLSRKKKPV
jgi:DNA-3-methyladenine glycosylase II